MPYIFGQAVMTHQSGIPMMRPMVLEYPDDPGCQYLDRQYFFGEDILVAPVFNESGEVSYYLPEGTWTDYLSGEEIHGGSWQTKSYDYFSLPLMVPENRILLTGSVDTVPDYDYTEGLVVEIFRLAEDCVISRKLYDSNGEFAQEITARKSGDTITVSRKNQKNKQNPWSILLRNIDEAATVGKGSSTQTGLGIRIQADADQDTVTIKTSVSG